ncbi:hypothetical protein FBU30_006290 [Linnemannia zychae]|nr:hypothetical protein FBU30_006290 [Linnemannia zychae]
MKIKKAPVKKLAVPPLPIRNLIKMLKECPETELAAHIEATPEWTWPRGDLFHWVGVLNRFDEILDTLCKTHDMKKPQPKEFSAADRRLVLAILNFSRLLLESCTNRNLYASYEQLNDLLNTRDLDILESCLRLLLRPAQRHSAQRSARSIFTVSQDRLLALAHSWGSREYGLDLQQLADDSTEIPERLRSVSFQFFRTVTPTRPSTTDSPITPSTSLTAPSSSTSTTSAAATPLNASAASTSASGKPRRRSSLGVLSSQASIASTGTTTSGLSPTSEGLVVIQVSDPQQLGATDYDILNHLVQEYKVPEEYHFQLLSRIRIATAIQDPKRRRQLLLIRILAIAVMSHVFSEAIIVEKFFAFEPEIIQSLTDLIHPDHKVPFSVQTVAIFALDGLAHLRNKQQDVLTAINASASHGVLLYALRKVIAGLDSENVPYPQDFLDAMFAFISYIISSQTGGNMVISAGLVPTLLQLLSNKQTSQLKNVTKSITILDSLIYGFGSAFTSFCTSDGLNILVARMKEEVDYAMKLAKEAEASQMAGVSATDVNAPKEEEISPVPFERTALSKAMFKFIIHMMQSPGTHEGLRNLIETTLPATLRDIMENPSALGNSIYAHAINTMTSFIHNEPTSLSILQEAKIPQTLLTSLMKDIPASNDVVMNLPGAFGAICLNSAGLEMFTKDFDIKKFFDVFISIPHVRAFQDSDIASTLGVSVDELVRHQPSLKPKVMTVLDETLKAVLKMCESDAVKEDDTSLCTLQKTRAKDAPPLGEAVEDDINRDDRKDSLVAQLIEGSARFCESFFQNAASAHEFLKAGGIDTLLKFYSLPTLPYDMANSSAFFTLSHLLKLLSEANPAAAITAVVKEVNRVLQQVQPLLDSTNPNSELVQYIDITDLCDEAVARGNNLLRSLISLHAFSGLLSDMYCAPTFSHGRNSAAVLAAFVSAQGDEALSGLGQLHRVCVWESIAMKRILGKDWNDPNLKGKRTHTHVPMPGTVDENVEEPTDDKEMTAATSPVDIYSPTVINTKFLRFVLTQIPQYITPMYQGITKMLYSRREMEPAQRVNAFKIADSLSKVLQSHINWKRPEASTSLSDKYTYLGTMFNLLPYLLLDERNPTTLQTIMAISFFRTGGLEASFTWLDSAWSEASSIKQDSSSPEKEQKALLAKVYGCVETLLSVLQTFTSSKLLLESSHTGPLTSKDDKNRKYNFFNPHEFLVEVRLLILPHIRTLWMDNRLNQCPALLVRHVIQIIINILKAAGELKPPVVAPPSITSGTGAGTGAGTSATNVFGVRPLVPDANSVAMLLDMGFPRSAAELALTRSGNQLERATEYLLTHQEVVAAAIYEQEREEAAARAAAIAAANEPPVPPAVTESADTGDSNATAAPATETTEQTSSAPVTTTDSNNELNANDEEEEDEEEMLRQALEMSRALDVAMAEDESNGAPRTQESNAGEEPDASQQCVAPTTVEETNSNSAIDIEDDKPTEEEKNEDEYKLALERHQENKDMLSKARDELKPLLLSRSLELIESIDDIVFYIRDLLLLLYKDKDNTMLENLVKDLERSGANLTTIAGGHAFGAQLRLLALLFGDVGIQSKMVDHATVLVALLLSILEKHINSHGSQKDNAWISPLLLMIESFISLSDEPKIVPDEATQDGKNKAAARDKEMKEDIVSSTEMENLLQYCITLLQQEDLTKDVTLSVFRILVRLTRHHSLAMTFLKAHGLELIFSTLRPDRIGVQGQQSFIIMILRHIIEDTVVLQEVMEKEIVRWFNQPSRARTGDLQSYLRHNNFLGLRDLDAFIAGTLAVSKVSKYDSSYRALQLTLSKPPVSLKPEDNMDQMDSLKDQAKDKEQDKEQDKESKDKEQEDGDNAGEGSSTSLQPPIGPQSSAASVSAITEAAKKYSNEISEAVIHFLVTELLSARDSTLTSSSTAGSSENVKHDDNSATKSTSNSEKDVALTTTASQDTNFIHRCFVLQCLNELLISYPNCKVDLMNYSRRKGNKDSSQAATKPRSNWLNFLLNDLIPYRGTVVQSSETELRKHSIESNFASSVLVAMCSNGDEEEEKKPFSDLVQVRRFVIDGIIRSFKDAIASTQPIEFKYGKFLSLSELSYKILGSSPSAGAMAKPSEDMSINIVKVMLEKNFILTLTNVLADIDLNYPHAKILVNAVLKPLEHLTKLSLKMSRATDPSASRSRRHPTPMSGVGSGAGSDDDAPDLYRNSALGLIDGTALDTTEDDDSEEEGEEDGIFEGEEFDEETASDASDLSEDDLSEDDDEEDELEEMVDRNPFHHHSHELSDDEEDSDDEDMESDEGDDEDEDEELDEEMEAELQEALDDADDDDEEMMEWDADARPIILRDDEIGEVIDDEDDPQVADPEYYDEQDRAHRHHTHTNNSHLHGEADGLEDGEDEGDEDEDGLEDLDEDEEGDEDDDEDDDDIVLLDDVEGFDPVRAPGRGGPWDMTSTFVINDQSGLLNGAQLIDLRGRRPRVGGRRLDDRGFVGYDSTLDQGRFSYIEDDDFPLLGAPARNPFLQVSDDVITHPLLAPPRPTSTNVTVDGHRRSASRGGLGGGISDWHAFEELLNGNPSQILGTLMNGGAIRASHGAFRVEVNSGHGHAAILTPIDRVGSRGVTQVDTTSATAGGSSDQAAVNKPDMFSIVQNFVPFSTSQRWSQECRMMYGATAQDKATRLMNHITNALIPAAKEEYRLKQERDAKELEIRRKAEAEKKRIAEEKKKAEEEAERIRAEEAERVRLAEAAAAAEREAARQAELAAARVARGETEEDAITEGAMEVEETTTATSQPSEEAEPAAPSRRTVMIDGAMVDITDSDIDPEFLEALPEDMRREVYNDYLQSRRPPAPTTTQQPTTSTSAASQSINPDFLDALPQNMRAELDEILRGQGAISDDSISGLPMLTAFSDTLSRLVPQLRQIYQDGGSNSAAIAEASAILDRMPRNYPGLREVRNMVATSGPGSSAKKPIVPRDAIQLVDKSSLATLVRLMFLPQPPSKNILNKLLANLCENSKTRTELLSLLLSILQDGGADLAAVDKSFAQMSLRGKPIVKAHHHKGKGTGTVPAPAPSAMDNVPNLVARRCFESLNYIVSLNSQAAQFFLAEHENVALKRSLSHKGKGKDKDKAVSSKYPIVLLLGLLERPTFVESSALMEQLMTLLSILCRPLATLAKDEEDNDKQKEKKKDVQENVETEGHAAEHLITPASTEPATGSTSTVPAIEEGLTSPSTTAATETAAETATETAAEVPATTHAPATVDSKPDAKSIETDVPALKPPVIPDQYIQLVVRVLTAGECSSRTFQYTLSVIQNLSALEGARDVITAELVRAARELGAGILEDLDTLSETLTNAMAGVDVQGIVLEQFTPASSKQARLLRVLKTIDYMYSRKQNLNSAPVSTQVNIELAPTVDPEEADALMPRSLRDIGTGPTTLNKDEEKATQIYDSLAFQTLWTKVGDTLEKIHERSDMVHVATVLLPLIESFMVVCKYVGLRPSTLEMEEAACKATTNSTEELFLQFTERHSKILNIMVRNNPALMSGSFSLLVHNPKMLEFDNKRNYFTQQVHKRTINQSHYGTLQMNVRREMVFIDSFTQLQSRSGEEIKYSKLNVHFHGEEGVDAGGVTREWFQVLARQMFNPDYAMFKTSAADKLTYQPNRASWVNPDHLLFFKFIGRVIGKAIYDGRLLDAYFTRSFYKHILGRPVDYRDVEAVDPEYYKSLVWMLENDITDIVDETFSVETDDFGNMKTVDLKPNGRNIPVTEENKHEYVKYITEQKLTLAIKDQIHSFLQGFHEIIPANLISIFNEQELELLISGLPDIDVDEWKNNTEYQNYTQASPQIQYFWRAVRSFDQTERAKLLQFVTGTSKVPLGGFSQLQGISGVQKFQIHKDFSSTKRLPSAHTWYVYSFDKCCQVVMSYRILLI